MAEPLSALPVQAPAVAAGPTVGMAILVWSADLSVPERAATPFVMAQAAAALDLQVEMYFTAQAVRLLDVAQAQQLIGFGSERASLAQHLRATQDAGVRMLACSQALHAQALARESLHPACAGLGGAVQFMSRAAEPLWRSLVF